MGSSQNIFVQNTPNNGELTTAISITLFGSLITSPFSEMSLDKFPFEMILGLSNPIKI